jgi:hypothetical protein
VKYEQTIGDVKAAVASRLGVPVEQQQLFWHKKELTEAYDTKTLLEMNMHTGFALKGYDLVSASGGAMVGNISKFLVGRWKQAHQCG